MDKLLSRDAFRNEVFARDKNTCCICPQAAQDAHHIIERRLFPDGGYYLDNGASLCADHHLQAERTTLSPGTIREKAGIKDVILPPHLYRDQEYDKWGNPCLANGTRLKGDLFFDASVQKALDEGGVLTLFTNHVKFPRTYHLPWSLGVTKDDRKMGLEDPFKGHRVVATVKMDGENTTIYNDGIHARSLVYEPHPSRNWPKVLAARISHDIPEGWRVCGENLWAEHSISYRHLEDYFLVFSIWNEKNICLSWDDTKEWATLLDLKMVPTIYEGLGDKHHIENLYTTLHNGDACEGYVVRLKEAFPYSAYRTAVGKYVRANHVATHGHWMRQMVKPNRLANDTE